MSRRAAAVAHTRQRIVEAALELHGEQGIAATSWDDIAARAGVGVGTVYRHFPSLGELIPACGDIALQRAMLPDAAATEAIFDGAADDGERVERLVRECFAIYERGAAVLRAIRRDSGVHPRVAADNEAFEATLDALVDAAFAPARVSRQDRALVRAMVDLNTWDALRDQGLEPAEAAAAVAGLLAAKASLQQP